MAPERGSAASMIQEIEEVVLMTPLFAASLLLAAPSAQAAAPVELDRIVSTVHTTKIWQSDIRQARMLKLCPSADTDDAILAELQNRALMLAEAGRAQPYEPTAEEVTARRREWESALGAGAGLDALLLRAGMSPRDLQAWHRDELRLRKYLDQRFGSLPAAQRTARTRDWIADLRQRAGLR